MAAIRLSLCKYASGDRVWGSQNTASPAYSFTDKLVDLSA